MKENAIITICILLLMIPSYLINGQNLEIQKDDVIGSNIQRYEWYFGDQNNYSCLNKLEQDMFYNDKTLDIIYPNSSIKFFEDDDIIQNIISNPIWPQFGYNVKHIGRCPYSTANITGIEKWRYEGVWNEWCGSSPAIGSDGTIYFLSDFNLYAMNPNGTAKWIYDYNGAIGIWYGVQPAIAEDGTIYFGTEYGGYVNAIYPNGTKKWAVGGPEIYTSITIGDDGILYYGNEKGVEARYSNGTRKWRFSTGSVVHSTPAIDDNGVIYFGSHDKYIYAVYHNGTLKWKYKTGAWVHGCPSIGDDGTIYCGADDDHFYAFYPNGTLKWNLDLGTGMWGSPSQDKDGNLYFGTYHSKIFSVSPNGSIRWVFPLRNGDRIWPSTAAISDDGTLYIGNNINFNEYGHDGGEIIALDLNGNLKWRKILSDLWLCSSPVITDDGAVYICSSWSGNFYWGYLNCFDVIEYNDSPTAPIIDGHTLVPYLNWDIYYTFRSDDPDNNPIGYFIDWGDGKSEWTIDCESGEKMETWHAWSKEGNYTISSKARDSVGAESNWSYYDIQVKEKPEDISYFGLISNLEITNTSVTFHMVFGFNSEFPIIIPLINQDVELPNDYEGYIGEHFVWATFCFE